MDVIRDEIVTIRKHRADGVGLSMHNNFSNEVNRRLSIKHVLADGRRVDSIDGFVIPNTGASAAVYNMVAVFAQRNHTFYTERGE